MLLAHREILFGNEGRGPATVSDRLHAHRWKLMKEPALKGTPAGTKKVSCEIVMLAIYSCTSVARNFDRQKKQNLTIFAGYPIGHTDC